MGNDRRDRRNRARASGGSGDEVEAKQLLGGFLDRFTSVDDILRQLDETVDSLDTNVRNLSNALDEQTALSVEVTEPDTEERPYDFSTQVPASVGVNDPVTETFTFPHDGTVSRVVIGWPDGAQQQVGVSVTGTSDEALIPAGPKGAKYIGLNDKVLEFNLDDPVFKGEEYTIKFANNDGSQDHFINAIIFLDGGD